MQDKSDFYQIYMQSKEWAHKRLLRLKIDHFKCRTCWSIEDLEVHHLTYERLGNEDIQDLITLCHYCHESVTCSIRERRYKGKDIKFCNEEFVNFPYVENTKIKVDFGKEQKEKQLNYVMENTNNSVDFGIASNPAQWQSSRPDESNSKRDKENIFQTSENRRRLYRNGPP